MKICILQICEYIYMRDFHNADFRISLCMEILEGMYSIDIRIYRYIDICEVFMVRISGYICVWETPEVMLHTDIWTYGYIDICEVFTVQTLEYISVWSYSRLFIMHICENVITQNTVYNRSAEIIICVYMRRIYAADFWRFLYIHIFNIIQHAYLRTFSNARILCRIFLRISLHIYI